MSKKPTHTNSCVYHSDAQTEVYLEITNFLNQLKARQVQPVAPYDLNRMLLVATARNCYEVARLHGYDGMGPVWKKEMLKMFSEMLDLVDGDTSIIQIMPH